MNKKNIILLSLVLILIISMLTGCGSKPPKETLKEAYMNTTKMKTSKQGMEIAMNLEMENVDPMAASFLQMFRNVKIKMEMSSDLEKMNSAGKITIDLEGMTYNSEIYATPEKAILKIPIFPQYILIEQGYQVKTEDRQQLTSDILKSMLAEIEDKNIHEIGKNSLSTPEGDIKVTQIEINFADEEMKEIIEKLILPIYDNEIMREYMSNSLKSKLQPEGKELTDEEIQTTLDEMKNEFENSFNELDEAIHFDNMKVLYSIDKDDNIRHSDFEMIFTIQDQETEQKIKINLQGTNHIWNINKPVDIKIPDVNEQNAIKIEEMTKQFMGPMPSN